jgi:hypothetical protein
MSQDPEVVAQQLAKEIERLLAEADRMLSDSKAFYKKHGLEPDFYQKLVADGRVTADQQAQVARDLAKYQDDLETDVRATAAARSPAKHAPKPPSGGVRV